MNKKKWISILLCLVMVFTCITPVFADTAWTSADFTYDSEGTTITGLSDAGKEKIKTNPNIVIPEGVVALGAGVALQGMFVVVDGEKNYTPASVSLPSTLKTIGNFAFALNPNKTYEAQMTSITLPNGLETIGNTVFQNSKLTSISIPDSVTTMGQGVFSGSCKITSIKLSKNVVDIPQSAFSLGSQNELGKLTTLVIPEGVKSVGKSAFVGAGIEKLVLPSTLETIGQQAFENNNIETLVIPESVKKIDKRAFRSNSVLVTTTIKTVVLNEGLTEIGQEAFSKNGITEIYLPSTLTVLGKKAFENQTVVAKVTDATQVNLTNATNNPNLTLQHDSAAKAITAVKDDAALASAKVTYTGSELKPAVTITGLVEGTDFEVTYRDNVEVGTATAEVVGKGDYYGSFRLTFEIEAAPAPTPTPTPTPTVPVTGDTAPMALMVALMAVAAAGGFVAYRKRNN